ncbi:hypothetical protein BSZ19_01375 [Bradyrhizobium japonicum]|uniref:Uncharacterized protein n=1 Tax=Bradyrhizobium japonicum TaxID=375 RepID=A0A1Y2JXS7_BRAJP|nr:hypothetical protein BSZ19_01375 [Bradyrhizobium japonicum]
MPITPNTGSLFHAETHLASPALGLIASGARLNALFLVSSATVLCASLVAWWLIATPSTLEGSPQ